MAIGVQTDMATPALARFGSDQLKRDYLAPAIAGDMVVSIAVSEPSAGSDVASEFYGLFVKVCKPFTDIFILNA